MTRKLFFTKARYTLLLFLVGFMVPILGFSAPTMETTGYDSSPPINCNAAIMPGVVAANQSNCGPFDPGVITNVTSATSTEGPVQYLWMYRNASTGWLWASTGVTTDSIDPGMTTTTTDYIRCVGLVGCPNFPGETNSVRISVYPPINPPVMVSTDITCHGDMNGTATATVTGGGGPNSYFYQWSNGATTASISGLGAGTYNVSVVDTNGCTASGSVTIAEPAALSEVTSSTNVTCHDGTDGSATFTVTGGTAPISILWSDGQTIATATGLSAGAYTVVATDANGCTISGAVTITEPADLVVSSTSTGLSCNTSMNATIDATVTGGVLPYTYSWSNGATTEDLTGLNDGTYTLTVTDANGCTATEVVVIAASQINCCDLLVPGTIGFNQTNCGPFVPNTIVSLSAGQNLSGAPVTDVEYLWMYRDSSTNGNWLVYGGGITTDSLVPGLVSTTTEFIRCIRNAGCITYPGETNIVTITIHPVPTLTVSSTDVTCNGDDDGTATAIVNGGTAGSSPMSLFTTLAADNGQDGNMFDIDATNDVTINNFDVHMDGAGTNQTVEIYWKTGTYVGSENTPGDWTLVGSSTVVSQGFGALTSVPLPVNVSIPAGTSAAFYITATTSFFHYTNGTGAGNVFVSDANIDIKEGIGIAYAFGGTFSPRIWNGTVHYSAGVAGGYTYNWSNGDTTATTSGLAPGTYTVTITDANGCTATDSVTITEPTALAEVTTSTNITCNGDDDGTAKIVVSGGTPPYTYNWSNQAMTDSISGLAPGTYTVNVTDANGCMISQTVTITEPAALAETTTSTDVSCNGGADGTAMFAVTGGTAPYTYLWNNAATTASISGLVAGTYTVTATDANGCTISGSVTITEPTALAQAMTFADVSCNGGADGSAMFAVSGGTSPYTYLWSDGQTTASATGLTAGSYTVVATDANGCTISGAVTINEPTALSEVTTSTNVTCFDFNDGTAMIVVSGGTAPYTYLWSTGDTGSSVANLAPGTHTVTATDANGCTISSSVTITEPAFWSGYVSVIQNVSCNGGSDGSIVASIFGGTGLITYEWRNLNDTTVISTNDTLMGVPAGTYSVTYTDANGCSNLSVPHIVTEPDALTEVTTSTDVSCNAGTDGTAMIVVTGGTSPYTYLWSDGQTNASATGLAAGTYTVTATDANGCTISGSTTISEPTALMEVTTHTDVSCNAGTDGTAMFTVTGGTSPYTYLWSNSATTASISGLAAGTYTVVATDSNGCTISGSVTISEPTALTEVTTATDVSCNGGTDGTAMITVSGGTTPYTYLWNNGATTASISGLMAGTYTVTVTDANGCVISSSAVVSEPTALTEVTTSTDVSCNGGTDGTAMMTVTGGTAPYTYLWSNGATTASLTGLGAGTYTVTATDANGCTIAGTTTISEPTALMEVTTSTNVNCFAGADGTAMIAVTGGTAPYTYLWSNGATTASVSGLVAGTYTVTATDANGCTIMQTVVITQPAVFLGNISGTNVSCNGLSDGSVTIAPLGGTMPYTYSWNDPSSSTTATVTGLPAGTYTVLVTDANGCTLNKTVTITEPAPLAEVTTSTDVSCNAGTDGTAMISVTGGTAPYTYLWSNGGTTASISGLAAGTYTVTATDANGCTISGSATITEPDALTELTTATDVSCNGGADGSATALIAGGTMPYTYDWSNGGTTATISGLAAGTYALTVTDANGCMISSSAVVAEPTALAEVTTSTDVSCNGGTDGTAMFTVSGGTAPYTYLWSNSATTASISGLAAGTYTVVATDANGCTIPGSVTISEPTALAEVTTSTDVSCNGGTDGTAMVAVSGGTAPYTYMWNNGATTASISGLMAGTYSVTVTDANGCMIMSSATVSEPTALTSVSSSIDVTCNNFADGSATIVVSGGTPGYTYLWSDGQTTATATDLGPGTYTVTATDANGCTTSQSVVITEPVEFHNYEQSTDASCFGACDGYSTATHVGGVAPFTYLWSTGDTTASNTGLCAGSYTVTATDANGCIATASVLIGEPNEIAVSFTIDSVAATILASGQNGSAPYTYAWTTGLNSSFLSGAVDGTWYTVTVTDANGCTKTDSVLYENATTPIIIGASPNPFTTTTKIEVMSQESAEIIVNIYNAQGSVVETSYNGHVEAGVILQLILDGNSIEPGIYFIGVNSSVGKSSTKKIILVD